MCSLRVVVLATLFAAIPCRADVLLDRLGPTNQGTSSGRSQLEVSGLPTVIGTQKMVAVPIVTASDYLLTSVDSSFSRGNTSNPEVTFELWGAHPGTGNPDRSQIIEVSPTRLVVPGGTGVVPGTFVFAGTSRLLAGVRYWIVARKQTGPGSVFMTENVISNTDPWVFTSNGFLNGVASTGPATYPGPALRVNGAPCSLAITRHPSPANVCPGSSSATFSVEATGTPELSYRWEIETSPGNWQGLGNDPFPLPCGGFAYASQPFSSESPIGIHACPGQYTYQIRALVSNPCGSIASDPAAFIICIGDFNCDGGVDGSDVEAFFAEWEDGNASADLNGDGGVDGADVQTFFEAWESGC